jgi:hypothetical protein
MIEKKKPSSGESEHTIDLEISFLKDVARPPAVGRITSVTLTNPKNFQHLLWYHDDLPSILT